MNLHMKREMQRVQFESFTSFAHFSAHIVICTGVSIAFSEIVIHGRWTSYLLYQSQIYPRLFGKAIKSEKAFRPFHDNNETAKARLHETTFHIFLFSGVRSDQAKRPTLTLLSHNILWFEYNYNEIQHRTIDTQTYRIRHDLYTVKAT
jgi:hypothetical protein